MQLVPTICTYCGTGCGLYLAVEEGKAVGIEYLSAHPASEGALCPKGNALLQILYHPDRLLYPQKKENGAFKRISWDEAYGIIADKLKEIISIYGSDAVAFYGSAQCTNEENYLLQKMGRLLGTNNIDHCARLCHAPSVAALAATLGSGAMTNTIHGFADSDCILIVGSNFTENHPVISRWVLDAKEKGAKIIVVDPRYTPTAWFADSFLQLRPGTDIALINGMISVILKEKLYNYNFIEERTEGFDDLGKSLVNYSLQEASKITGIPEDSIKEAARLYARAKNASIIYCMGVTQHRSGTDNVIALSNLALICGNFGRPGTGINPLRGQANVQGSCDMGVLPSFFPGYVKISDKAQRKRIANLWGVEDLPTQPGLTIVEIINAVHDGRIKGAYVMGESLMVSDPDTHHVEEALHKLDFLIVQDIFMTETAALADILLPAVCYAEKEGSVTSTERRVQWRHKAIEPPGEAKADWKILCELAEKMGLAEKFMYNSAEEILIEINKAIPAYGGITPARLKENIGGLCWPCPDSSHQGTPILHISSFRTPSGKGIIKPVVHREPAEIPNYEYPFTLTTGRLVLHYNSGNMTRRSPSLNKRVPEVFVEINRKDAEYLGIKPDERVKVISRRGSVEAKALITRRVAPGVVFLPFHFPGVNRLTIAELDPVSKIPEFKVATCRIEKVADQVGEQ